MLSKLVFSFHYKKSEWWKQVAKILFPNNECATVAVVKWYILFLVAQYIEERNTAKKEIEALAHAISASFIYKVNNSLRLALYRKCLIIYFGSLSMKSQTFCKDNISEIALCLHILLVKRNTLFPWQTHQYHWHTNKFTYYFSTSWCRCCYWRWGQLWVHIAAVVIFCLQYGHSVQLGN